MTSSPVSRKIKEFETALGVLLFERDTRHVQLSPVGMGLVPIVRELLEKLDELEWLVPRLATPTMDPIRIGLAVGTHPQHRDAMIRVLRENSPDRPVKVDVGITGPLLGLLHRGELMYTTLHRPFPNEGLGTRQLSDDEVGIVLAADHPLTKRGQLTVSSVRSLQYVTHRRYHEYEQIISVLGIRNILNLETDFQSDVAAAIATDANNFAIAVLNPASPLQRAFLDPGLVILPCPDLGLRMTTDFAWLESRARTQTDFKSLLDVLLPALDAIS
jgi:DNA-binding transcriptional LysR family regulator